MTVQPTRDQLRALADAATPGPWEADHSEEDNSSIKEQGREWWDGLAFAGRPDDAAFIAAARTAVPALLDALTRAEAQSETRLAQVNYWRAEARTQRHRADDQEDRAIRAQGNLDAAQARAAAAEARLQAVRDVLEEPDAMIGTRLHVTVDRIRRALEG